MKVETGLPYFPPARDKAAAPETAGASFSSMLESASWSTPPRDAKHPPPKPKRQTEPARQPRPSASTKAQLAQAEVDLGVTTAPQEQGAVADLKAFGFSELGMFGAYAASGPAVGTPVGQPPGIEEPPPAPMNAATVLAIAENPRASKAQTSSAIHDGTDTPLPARVRLGGPVLRAVALSAAVELTGEPRSIKRSDSSAQARDLRPPVMTMPDRRRRASVIVTEEDGNVQVLAATGKVAAGVADQLRRTAADLASRLGLRLIAFAFNGVAVPDPTNRNGAPHGPGAH